MIKIRKENEKLVCRLYNYKFDQALQYLEGESKEVKKDVKSLSIVFGDCGWQDGEMDNIIRMSLDSLGVWKILEEYEKEK